MAAAISHANDNWIAGFESATLASPDLFDRSGHFVTDDDRHTVRNPTFDDFIVGMAHTAGFDFDEHFIGRKGGHLEIFKAQRIVNFV